MSAFDKRLCSGFGWRGSDGKPVASRAWLPDSIRQAGINVFNQPQLKRDRLNFFGQRRGAAKTCAPCARLRGFSIALNRIAVRIEVDCNQPVTGTNNNFLPRQGRRGGNTGTPGTDHNQLYEQPSHDGNEPQHPEFT